jgi:nucleoside phosphorylase
VFIALDEELKYFLDFLGRKYGIAWAAEDHLHKAFTYHRALLSLAGAAAPISLAVFGAGEMGPDRAANATSALLEYYDPGAVVVIGIAGALSDDMRLGDIVVPDEIWSYLANSAVDDANENEWKFTVSGNHFRADAHLLNQTRQVERRVPLPYRAWKHRCAGRLARALKATTGPALELETVTRRRPKVFAGDHQLASGPSVGRSDSFVKWLLAHDRKAVALEMESASVFDAVETEIRQRRPLAIRGISDFADQRKKTVEKSYKGTFRKVSMVNAIDFFCLLIEAGVFGATQ